MLIKKIVLFFILFIVFTAFAFPNLFDLFFEFFFTYGFFILIFTAPVMIFAFAFRVMKRR